MVIMASEESILEKLQSYFGYTKFRNVTQKEAILAIVERKHDIYISMPTGSGKSLCYQLPAVLQENKVALIFSPLIALMKDQIDHLTKLNIKAATLNSTMSNKERVSVLNEIMDVKCTIKLLYLAPEQMKTESFSNIITMLYNRKMISYIAVDEAHCISQWGHDFRDSYLKLADLKAQYQDIPWIILTATASADVEKDIIKILKLDQRLKKFKVPCFRSNLFYDVVFRDTLDNDIDHLKKFILKTLYPDDKSKDKKKDSNGCGIIYCRTREMTESVASELSQKGIPIKAYHAGLSKLERGEVQSDWMNEKYPVITATVSFGMGIDKANVRFVVHWGFPQSVAAYYQESGRAGRDGLPSYCRIYYSKKECEKLDFILKNNILEAKTHKKEQAKVAYKSFECMLKYCINVSCRHGVFAKYFGDDPPACNKKCDVCRNPLSVQKQIDEFYEKTTRYQTTRMKITEDDGDLYGGGRRGLKMESDEYSSSGEASSNEVKAKKELEAVIKRQFQFRKASELAEKDETDLEKCSKVKAPTSTRIKVNGLKVGVRETFADKLKELLWENASKVSEEERGSITEEHCWKCARELEYNDFKSTRVVTMYRRGIMKTMGDIKKFSKDSKIYPFLLDFNCETDDEKEKEGGEVKYPDFTKAIDMVCKREAKEPKELKELKETKETKEKKEKKEKRKNPLPNGQKKVSEYFKIGSNPKAEDEKPESSCDAKERGKEEEEAGNEERPEKRLKLSDPESEREENGKARSGTKDEKDSEKKKSNAKKVKKNAPVSLKLIDLFGDDKIPRKAGTSKKSNISGSERIRVSDMVVKHLMPAYNLRKLIKDREHFKIVARKISKSLLEKNGTRTREEEVHEHVQKYLEDIAKENR